MKQQWLIFTSSVILILLIVASPLPGIFAANRMHLDAYHLILSTSPSVVGSNSKVFSSILPNTTADWMWIAEAYSTQQLWDEAKNAYRQYLALQGDTRQALLRLRQIATVHRWCLTHDIQLIALAETLTDKSAAYLLLGYACESTAQLSAAITAYRTAFTLTSTLESASKLAWVLFQRAEANKDSTPTASLADYTEIVEALSAVSLAQGTSRDYYLLGWSAWQLNRFDQALDAYAACLSTVDEKRYNFSCALNLSYAYVAWLPEQQRSLAKARLYYHQAETFAFDNASRLAVKQLLQQLEGQTQ